MTYNLLHWIWGSNPCGGETFRAVPTCPGAHPASYTVGTGSLLGISWPECGADHPPPPSHRLRMGWSYTLTSSICLQRHVVGLLSHLRCDLLIRFPLVITAIILLQSLQAGSAAQRILSVPGVKRPGPIPFSLRSKVGSATVRLPGLRVRIPVGGGTDICLLWVLCVVR